MPRGIRIEVPTVGGFAPFTLGEVGEARDRALHKDGLGELRFRRISDGRILGVWRVAA